MVVWSSTEDEQDDASHVAAVGAVGERGEHLLDDAPDAAPDGGGVCEPGQLLHGSKALGRSGWWFE